MRDAQRSHLDQCNNQPYRASTSSACAANAWNLASHVGNRGGAKDDADFPATASTISRVIEIYTMSALSVTLILVGLAGEVTAIEPGRILLRTKPSPDHSSTTRPRHNEDTLDGVDVAQIEASANVRLPPSGYHFPAPAEREARRSWDASASKIRMRKIACRPD
jgi:hypothetical protein